MNDIGKYIYGVINSPDGFLRTNGAHLIPYKDISAIVSDSPIVDYSKVIKEELAYQLLHHQRVIESVRPEYSVIPMRLGTFVLNENEALEVLDKGYSAMKQIFGKIENRLEMDLVVMWSDFKGMLREAGEGTKIKKLKEKLLCDPREITREDQMKVGFMIQETVNNLRKEYAGKILKVLSEASEDYRAHECMDDTMVMNTAFLLSKYGQRAFEAKIDELNDSFAEKLNFRCVGPLPLYSFYTLEVVKICQDRIEWAKETLGLEGITTKDQIKKAYQRTALLSHPDRHPGEPGIEAGFNETAKAYKILRDCWTAFEQAGSRAGSLPDITSYKKDVLFVTARE